MEMGFKRSLLIAVSIRSLALTLNAQCDEQTWTFQMDTPGSDVVQRMAYHANGDLYMAGTTSISGDDDLLLARFTDDTVLVWARTYDLSGADGGESLALHMGASGSIYITGAMAFGGNQQDAALLKLDEDGAVQWARRILPLGGLAHGRAVMETPEGDVMIGGSTNSIGAGNVDAFVARFTSGGTLSWLNSYGGSGQDHFTHMYRLPDDTYVLGSQTSSFGPSTRKGYLARIDAAGAVVDAVQFGGLVYDDLITSYRNDNGTYLRIGFTDSYGPGVRDVLAVLTDSGGGVIWARAYGTPAGSELGLSAVSDGGSGWFVSAYTNPDREMHLLHLRPDGSLQRVLHVEGMYVTNNASWTETISPAADGNYWLFGSDADLPGAGISIVKLDACGVNHCDMTDVSWSETSFTIPVQSIPLAISASSTNVQNISTTGVDVTAAFSSAGSVIVCEGSSVREIGMGKHDRIAIHPNPVTPGQAFTLDMPDGLRSDQAELWLMDLSGRLVQRLPLQHAGLTIAAMVMPGTYLLRLVSAQRTIATAKLVVM